MIEKIFIVELDVPICSRTFGVGPCEATGEPCFNTSGTCKFRAALDTLGLPQTYRFCTNMAPLPLQVDTKTALLPSLAADPRITAPQLDLSGGLGVRGAATIELIDHPFDDRQFNADPYVDTRTYDPYEQGTFWTKYRARDPYYVGRTIRVIEGEVIGGEINPSYLSTKTYIVEQIKQSDGRVTISAKDVLKLADDKRAKYPLATNAELDGAISSGSSSLTVIYSGADIDTALPDTGGIVRIDDELMTYTSRTGLTLSGLTRGQYGTQADAHSDEADVQLAVEFDDQLHLIIQELLTVGAGISSTFIPIGTWAAEVNNQYATKINGVIAEPTGVNKLLKEISDTTQSYLWWDAESRTIQLRISKPPTGASTIYDADTLLAGSYSVKDKPDARISQVWVYYGVRNPVRDLDEASNYELLHVRADLDSESREEYDSQRVRKIFSRWINRNNKTAAVILASKLGQRFGKTPREVALTVPAQGGLGPVELGDTFGVTHRLATDAFGNPELIYFQTAQRSEGDNIKLLGLEHPEPRILPGDPDTGFILYPASVSDNTGPAADLRQLYDGPGGRFPAGTIPPDTGVTFVIESAVVLAGRPGITTGDWSDLETAAGYPIPIKLQIAGVVSGHGGQGGNAYAGPTADDGQDGGNAIELENDLTIETIDGTVAAGGGGGGAAAYVTPAFGTVLFVGGAGGASYGLGGTGTTTGEAGDLSTGGTGSQQSGDSAPVYTAESGDGGNWNQPGLPGTVTPTPVDLYDEGLGGAKGDAIVQNGFTLTNSAGTGNIIGDIV